MWRKALLTAALVVGGCGDDEVAVDAAPGRDCAPTDVGSAALEPYYQDCSVDPCPAPYECVHTEGAGGAYDGCLLPCCVNEDCPQPHGCVGDPRFPVADVAPDGYCGEPP